MNRTYAIVLACVVVLAALGGCAGLGSDGETDAGDGASDDGIDAADYDAETVRADTLERMESADTYRFEMDIETSSDEGTARQSLTGRVDRTGERATVEMNSSIDSESLQVTSQFDVYLADGTYYLYSVSQDQWSVSEVEDFETLAQEEPLSVGALDAQISVLEAADEVEIVGTETVGGTETIVLSLSVDPGVGSGLLVEPGENEQIERLEYRQYVTPEGELRRVEIEQVIGSETQVVQTTNVTFADYGEPISVDLPDDAPEN